MEFTQELKDEINRDLKAVSKIAEFLCAIKEAETKRLPKLKSGGIVYGKPNELIQGSEVIAPFRDNKIYLDDNYHPFFQND